LERPRVSHSEGSRQSISTAGALATCIHPNAPGVAKIEETSVAALCTGAVPGFRDREIFNLKILGAHETKRISRMLQFSDATVSMTF
jgi:hypothetical protein